MLLRRTVLQLSALLMFAIVIALPARARDYQTVTFAAPHLGGMKISFNIILPRDYSNSNQRYPVLYLLHGYTDHYPAWTRYTHIADYARQYKEIIVMPEGDNSWYVNNYANPKLAWQDYLIRDLVPYVDSHFRTVASRNGRAVAGNSMGGYGALLLALKYPNMFAAAASLSGVTASARSSFSGAGADLRKVIAEDLGPLGSSTRKQNDLSELVRKVPEGEMPQLYLSVGTSDSLLAQNREFVKLLSDLKITYTYCEVPGKHEWPVWNREIQKVLAMQAPVIGAERNVRTIGFNAPHLGGRKVHFDIILPPDYAKSNRRYPVLYLLHGSEGNYATWIARSHIVEYARNYEELIVTVEGGESWYVNDYSNPKLAWQDYLIRDLIPYVDNRFRTIASRNGRALAGNSMGGYGALVLGLRYPQMFAAVASLSGAPADALPSFLDGKGNEYLKQLIAPKIGPPGSAARAASDPFQLVRKVPASQMPQIYLSDGSSDFLLQQNRDFVRLLSDLKIPYIYSEVPGGHHWTVWDPQIKNVLAVQAPIIGATQAGL